MVAARGDRPTQKKRILRQKERNNQKQPQGT